MKSEPYAQFISRYAHDIGAVLAMFHELNYYYNNQFIISLDSDSWELSDLRVNRVIFTYPFKKCIDFRVAMSTLMHDMAKTHVCNSLFNGTKKLKRTDYCAVRRILNLYGFDEYFVTNRNLINYIIYGEINKAKNLANCD